MKLTLRRDLGGYAYDTIARAGVDGTVIDHPFVLLTGPNGSGKSALMQAMRATIGLRGVREGTLSANFGRTLEPESVGGDVGILATHVSKGREDPIIEDHVPAVLDLHDLGWLGQPTYYFDSREASGLATKGHFDDGDMGFHLSMIAGRRAKSSHGQFISHAWWTAIRWGAGINAGEDPWTREVVTKARAHVRSKALDGAAPEKERWLFIDEPETALDAEALVAGLSVLLEIAAVGRLRVFCASHSLLFAAGLARDERIQTLDLGGDWLKIQRYALEITSDRERLGAMGRKMLGMLTSK